MKHLRLYESFNAKDIHKICKKYGIKNYVIRPDGKVDVEGNVNLSCEGLKRLPVSFGVVNGVFDCGINQLTVLEGCPEIIYGSFDCSNNQLTTLDGCPVEVNGEFWCSNNKLTSLEGCPEIADGDFDCHSNKLTNLKGCPEIIRGDFWCYNNQLTSLEHGPIEVNGDFDFSDNPLKNWKCAPEVVTADIYFDTNDELDTYFRKFLELNIEEEEVVKYILKEQSLYNIWKQDGSLNIPRFRQMIAESGFEINLPDDHRL